MFRSSESPVAARAATPSVLSSVTQVQLAQVIRLQGPHLEYYVKDLAGIIVVVVIIIAVIIIPSSFLCNHHSTLTNILECRHYHSLS